jgi:4-amino-4-deoxy-L-arabinose transferase-like glycosyltransferase
VNGFALALPNALAGLLSIPLLYSLVKRQFGTGAGLVAALVLAVTPVTVSTERNNTIDGLLVFVLLLAVWATLEAVRRGKFRYLLLGAVLVGLGFNIKMLQATMVLPALYALYLFCAPHPWWKRTLHLGAATVVLLVVSLSWALAVDLTPAEERPFIGSSTNNTVMELIIGHNGLSRLGLKHLLASDGPSQARGDGGDNLPRAGAFAGPSPSLGAGGRGQFPLNRPPMPPGAANQPGQKPPAPPPQGRGGRNQEVGEAGWDRLFSEPLVVEAGWLLPLVLLGLPFILLQVGWRWPLGGKHQGLILWAGWLLPVMAYFTFTKGLFHAYYLIMLGPPLAALMGITAWALWRTLRGSRWLGWMLVVLLSGATLVFQVYILSHYPEYGPWVVSAAILVWLAGIGSLAAAGLLNWRPSPWLGKAALVLVCFSLVVAPLVWSGLTTFNASANVMLPRSGPNVGRSGPAPGDHASLSATQQAVLGYLLANTDPDDYLVATLNARQAAPYILATLRPVLTFGGFTGRDDVIGAEELSQMVASGELRFVLGDRGLMREKPEIGDWLRSQCTPVTVPGMKEGATPRPSGPESGDEPSLLFNCGAYFET